MEPENLKELFVDDEPNLLSAIKRQFHKTYSLEVAESGQKSLIQLVNDRSTSVVVSDIQKSAQEKLGKDRNE